MIHSPEPADISHPISHHGAVHGVTGSCHELHIDDNNSILIDCGLFQGAETAADGVKQAQLSVDFPVNKIQALVITHVHIDHVGRIPYLLAAGFKGPVYCSNPSAVLLTEVLKDALRIGFTKNKSLIKQFIRHIRSLLVPLDYDEKQSISLDNSQEKLFIKLKPAGHILGSAYIECVIQSDQSSAKRKSQKKIIFSGDLGAPYAPLLPAPKSPYGCDQLIIESTYGDKNHPNRQDRQNRLKQIIERAVKNKGVILIPAFSIGRTQELLYELESLIHHAQRVKQNNIWKEIEVIVDSPLASRFTKKYRQLSEFWDAEAKNKLHLGRHPLDFSQLITINDHKTHLQTVEYLKKTARPAIVIAASGMCTGGRIVNYLTALLPDNRTDLVFTGYQAQGTTGRIIQKYADHPNAYVLIKKQKYLIKAQVTTISGYSAHADQSNLLNFIKRMKKKPRQIRIVHGDQDAKIALKNLFQSQFSGIDVRILER